MPDEFSVGKEAANFASTFLKNNCTEIAEFVDETIDTAKSSVKLRLKSTYTQYLTCIGERYSKVKTFLLNQDPVDLMKFYVPLGVSVKGQFTEYRDVTISDLTLTKNFNVITGTAGSGKSMMMRYLFLDSIKTGGKIPIFFELREFNSIATTLIEEIKRRLAENKFDLGSRYIDKALEFGHFILFLDGFDELAENRRDEVAKEIVKFANDLDKNQIVISSRPDSYFNQWPRFRVWSIADLTLPKACLLIDRLPYDEDIKAKFIKDLKRKLFEEHKYFLSNPLLLTIMWLCYGENAEIPTKYALFYERAYEALFNKHDARKGGFQRARKTSLDIKEFSDVFAAVAIQSFERERVEFSETEAIHYIDQAKKLTGSDFKSLDFLEDSIKAVCLLLEDGLALRFSHRSFQEYFTALFILRSESKVRADLLRRLLEGSFTQNVLDLAYSMDASAVENDVIIPTIEQIEKKIGYEGKVTEAVYKKFWSVICSNLSVQLPDSKNERIVVFHVRDRPMHHVFRLTQDCAETKNLPSSMSMKERRETEQKLLIELTKIRGSRLKVPIEEALADVEVLKAHLASPFSLHLDRLLALKQILLEKHRNRKASLKDILGI